MLSHYDKPVIEKVVPKGSPWYGNMLKSFDMDDALTREISKKSEVFKSYDHKPPMMSPSNFGSESVPLEGLRSS